MKFIELAQHIHQLRAAKTGRAIGGAMRLSEVWQAVMDSDRTDVSEIRYFEADLPEPFDGLFARLRKPDGKAKAVIYVRASLDAHWKEFVAIKELMHCFSPMSTWEGTADDSRRLVKALTRRDGRYTPNVAADSAAVHAALEVILPHKTVERHIANGHDIQQISAMHDLHEDLVEMICRNDLLHHRKNGSLFGDE